MEPITRKEKYYDGMINDTPVPDPITREEHLLKDLADKIAQGGGGATSVTLAASGDNLSGDISLADLKTALSNGVVLLSFPTDGNADERVVAEYTDDSTNGLRIGVFSEDEYIVYSVVDDGNDGVTLTVVSEKGIGGYVYSFDATTTTAVMGLLSTWMNTAVQQQKFYVERNTSVTFADIVADIQDAMDKYGNAWVKVPVNSNSSIFPVTTYTKGTISGIVISAQGIMQTQVGSTIIEIGFDAKIYMNQYSTVIEGCAATF